MLVVLWKTTNCCNTSTTWAPVTDDPLLATISIDSLTIDPNNHNTIYAGSLDDATAFHPKMAIFARDRPAWAPIPDGMTVFETMPGL